MFARALLLAVAVVLGVAGCGSNKPGPTITETHYYPAHSQTVSTGNCITTPDGTKVASGGTCTTNVISWPERWEMCTDNDGCWYVTGDEYRAYQPGDEFYVGDKWDQHPKPTGEAGKPQ